jgi:hypothetical protein
MALKRKLDDEVIHSIHYKAWEKAIKKHGDKFKVPKNEVALINERDRAMYCLQVWAQRGSEGSAARFLTKYALRLGTADWVLAKFCEEGDAVVPDKATNRKTQYRDFERWAAEHMFEQFTTAQLAEQSGFSQATVLKYVRTSPYFNKVKKGLYEARDPSKKSKEKSKVTDG